MNRARGAGDRAGAAAALRRRRSRPTDPPPAPRRSAGGNTGSPPSTAPADWFQKAIGWSKGEVAAAQPRRGLRAWRCRAPRNSTRRRGGRRRNGATARRSSTSVHPKRVGADARRRQGGRAGAGGIRRDRKDDERREIGRRRAVARLGRLRTRATTRRRWPGSARPSNGARRPAIAEGEGGRRADRCAGSNVWRSSPTFGFAERKASPVRARRLFRRHGRLADLRQAAARRSSRRRARSSSRRSREERSALGGQALAWGALMRGDWALARKWFETAIDWSGFDPLAPHGPQDDARAKLVEGYVQALRAGGDLDRAEDVAYVWRDGAAELGGLYLQIFTQELAADERRPRRRRGSPASPRSPRPSARRRRAGALGWRALSQQGLRRGDRLVRARRSPGRRAGRATPRSTKATRFRCAPPAGSSRPRISPGRIATSRASCAPPMSPRSPINCSTRSCRRNCRRAAARPLRQIVTPTRSAPARAALGWRRFKDGNCGYSLGWFRKAIAWSRARRRRRQALFRLRAGPARGRHVQRGRGRRLRLRRPLGGGARALHQHRHRGTDAAMAARADERGAHRPLLAASCSPTAPPPARRRSAGGATRRPAAATAGAGSSYAAGWSSDQRGDAHLNEGYALTQRAVGRLAPRRGDRLSLDRARAGDEEALHRHRRRGAFARQSAGADRRAAHRRVRGGVRRRSIRRSARRRSAGTASRARENEPAARWFADWRSIGGRRAAPTPIQKLAAPVDDYQPILAQLALRPEDYRRTPRAYPNSSLLIGHDAESYVNTEVGLAKTVEGYVRTLVALVALR